MPRQFLLSFRRKLRREHASADERPYCCVPWIESPLDENDKDGPHLYHRSDATPIELFFDLFFVACLATFTSTNEIKNLEALWSYVGFLGIIWFTWFQVTLFDVRFARDTVFERVCKAVQLATMVGFASAGSGFSTQVRDENVWIFHSFSVLLAASRLLLAVQYAVASIHLRNAMPKASKKLVYTSVSFLWMSFSYACLYYILNDDGKSRGRYLWTALWFSFVSEVVQVFWVSLKTPGIGFENTHLDIRMSLLTLIIIGEGVISITRIVNRTVGSRGWSRWSFVHILGVTTAVYLLWQSYHDISPRGYLRRVGQLIWTVLHFPFHIFLVLLSEGSQILALVLDIALKLKDLRQTIIWLCEHPRPHPAAAVNLLNSTIADMNIDYYRHRVLQEMSAIDLTIQSLRDHLPLCPTNGIPGFLDHEISQNLMKFVTVSLFATIGMEAPVGNTSSVGSDELLAMYLKQLGFVLVYYIILAAMTMFMFAAFVVLVQGKINRVRRAVMVGIRLVLGCALMSLMAITADSSMADALMTSPWVLFIFTVALLIALLGDRLGGWLEHMCDKRVVSVPTSMASMTQVVAPTTTISSVPGHGALNV
ncbi:hypothetical protein VTO42DRAFT_5263 [Malbranchea cinnamomea]